MGKLEIVYVYGRNGKGQQSWPNLLHRQEFCHRIIGGRLEKLRKKNINKKGETRKKSKKPKIGKINEFWEIWEF